MSNFHIVVIFNDYYNTNRSFFDETDTEQIQKQTCCNPPQLRCFILLAKVSHLK